MVWEKNIMKNGLIIFYGEYLNDKRWNGMGKEYEDKDELIFEGEYRNGEKIENIKK